MPKKHHFYICNLNITLSLIPAPNSDKEMSPIACPTQYHQGNKMAWVCLFVKLQKKQYLKDRVLGWSKSFSVLAVMFYMWSQGQGGPNHLPRYKRRPSNKSCHNNSNDGFWNLKTFPFILPSLLALTDWNTNLTTYKHWNRSRKLSKGAKQRHKAN